MMKQYYLKVSFNFFDYIDYSFVGIVASFPPFNMTELPDLIHKQATSQATFGLDSNVTAITQKGLKSSNFQAIRPLLVKISFPTGSAVEIFLMSFIIF